MPHITDQFDAPKGPEGYPLAPLMEKFDQWAQDHKNGRLCSQILPHIQNLISPHAFSTENTNFIKAAASLAQKKNNNPFHNNLHFLEVTALLDRLATHLKLSPDEHMCLIVAALIHDYQHDGGTNTVDGKHTPFRLEQMAFDAARETLEKSGMTKDQLQLIELLVRATDVSPDPNFNNISPAQSLKNYLDNNEKPDFIHPDLQGLLHYPNGIDLALTLHESDIGSAFLSLEKCMKGSEDLCKERDDTYQGKESSRFFVENIAGQRCYSRAGQALLQPYLNKLRRAFDLPIWTPRGMIAAHQIPPEISPIA